jgi:hypothetical protein
MNQVLWLVGVSLVSLVGACDDRIDGLALTRVEPSTATNKTDTPVTIIGEGFLVVPHSNFNDPDRAHSNTTFKAALGDVALAEVAYRSRTRLTGVVPAGLGPGPHDLTVRDPDGRTARLPEAFTILEPRDGGPDVQVMDLGPHDARPDTQPADGPKPDKLLPDGPVPPCWWNTTWKRRRKLTFNNQAQTQSLIDFPVLVQIQPSGLRDRVLAARGSPRLGPGAEDRRREQG